MTTPTTVIDARFSEPGASATSWDDAVQVLQDAELFWLSTVHADGRPHVTPLVAVWLDDAIHFSTGEDEQKAHNLRANPHVILTTGCNQWDRGLDVIVEGEAVRNTADAMLWRLADAWREKWDGQSIYEVPQQARVPPAERSRRRRRVGVPLCCSCQTFVKRAGLTNV